MMQQAQQRMLPDGRRLHLNHGPIDLIIEAFGDASEVAAAYDQAVLRFSTILDELVTELPALRQPSDSRRPRLFAGPTARRMEAAVAPLAFDFLTPMAAVAGSVADEMLAAMLAGRHLHRAYVNNGGDAALHIAPVHTLDIAIAGTGSGDRLRIEAHHPMRGVATSGWRGRSFSLGIADAVTVAAPTAAAADAAATVIANAVDLPGHAAVSRAPADALAPDNDLGTRLVTVAVGALRCDEVDQALASGAAIAERLLDSGAIGGAALFLQGRARLAGSLPAGPFEQASATRTREIEHA
jgi:ApbE superfamily uncharacterized protein (UPF0280 family)